MINRDIHELVGLAKLLVKMGIITMEQATRAMNISWTHWERDGWPDEPKEPTSAGGEDEKGNR